MAERAAGRAERVAWEGVVGSRADSAARMVGATVVEGATVAAAAEVGEGREAEVKGVQVRAAARVAVVRAALARVTVGWVAAAAKEAAG